MDDKPLNPLVVTGQMMVAAMDGDFDKCQRLTQKGADVRAIVDSHGRTPLHEVVARGHIELCRLLLESGADPNKPTNGFDPHNPTLTGTAPLHVAAASGKVEICRLLVEHGADIRRLDSHVDYFQYTPLQNAVIFGNTDVVRYFIEECGEDIDQQTQGGRTLVQLAREFSKYELADFLEVYQKAIKTEQAIRGALSVEGDASPPARSRVFSPL